MARTLTMVFDEYPDDEVVLRLSPAPLEDYFWILDEFDAIRTGKATRARMVELFRRFGDLALDSWTFPDPASGEGLLRRDFNLGIALVAQWIKGVRDVPLPLPLTPSGGVESKPESSPPDSDEPN